MDDLVDRYKVDGEIAMTINSRCVRLEASLMPAHRYHVCRSGRVLRSHTVTRNLLDPRTPDRELSARTASPDTPTLTTPTGQTQMETELPKTEPSTPTSPTLHTKGYRRAALRREQSAQFVQSVLHYDRVENDLQPWYW
jgi:hypothetical protein